MMGYINMSVYICAILTIAIIVLVVIFVKSFMYIRKRWNKSPNEESISVGETVNNTSPETNVTMIY